MGYSYNYFVKYVGGYELLKTLLSQVVKLFGWVFQLFLGSMWLAVSELMHLRLKWNDSFIHVSILIVTTVKRDCFGINIMEIFY